MPFIRRALASDPIYVEQIKRHYIMFRERVESTPSKDWWRKKKRMRL